MSLYQNHSRFGQGRHRPHRPVIVAHSDDEVRRRLSRWRFVLRDGPVDVEGKLIGWKRTDHGTLGGIVLNQLTNRRELWVLDFQTGKPRPLAVL